MIIAYRTQPVDGRWTGPGNNREFREGRITRVHDKLKKPPRPALLASESDWMVPNLRDPYAVHQADRPRAA